MARDFSLERLSLTALSNGSLKRFSPAALSNGFLSNGSLSNGSLSQRLSQVRQMASDFLVNPVQVNIGDTDSLVANKDVTQKVMLCEGGGGKGGFGKGGGADRQKSDMLGRILQVGNGSLTALQRLSLQRLSLSLPARGAAACRRARARAAESACLLTALQRLSAG